MTWHGRAECRGVDIEVFFRQRRAGRPRSVDPVEWDDAEAKSVCAVCEVTAECLAEGMRTKSEGVWGGLNPDERKALRARQGVAS